MPSHFSRDEAERTLPRVEPLLREIQALRGQQVAAEQKNAEERARVMSNGHKKLDAHDEHDEPTAQAEIERRLRMLLGEIAALGVLVKDLDTGLIDFPTLRDGREVYLCWRLGEGERIAWWHEIEAGFAGRQPLDPAP